MFDFMPDRTLPVLLMVLLGIFSDFILVTIEDLDPPWHLLLSPDIRMACPPFCLKAWYDAQAWI